MKRISLNKSHPWLAKQWHPTKNGKLTPKDVTYGNEKIKVWWKCSKGNDHEWQALIAPRARYKSGCPICSNKKIVGSNSLRKLRPDITKRWIYEKNKNLTPDSVGPFSHKKAWFKCPEGVDHIYFRQINTEGKLGCPICSNKIIVKSNCLATTHPNLANEWHPTKNGKLTPSDVGAGSTKKVWWKCNKGDDHEWVASIVNRKRGTNCPYCAGQKVSITNSLESLYPELAKEWHPTKNGKLTPSNVVAGSEKKVWWKCNKGDDHEWVASIVNRKKGNGCAICAGYKIVKSNCLATTHPNLAKEWHPTKNGKLTPFDITFGNNKKLIWWQCQKDKSHIWKTNVNNRTSGNMTGCRHCNLPPEITIKDVNDLVKSRGGKLLSKEIKNSRSKVTIECNAKHVFRIDWDHLKQGDWCGRCSGSHSEELCRVHFEDIFGENFFKTKPKWLLNYNGNRMEIDGYSEKLRIGFEYNGVQHYKKSYYTKSQKELEERINSDKLKQMLCKKNGVKLFVITYETDVINFEKEILRQAKKLKVHHLIKKNYSIDMNRSYTNKSQYQRLEEYCKSKNGKLLSKYWTKSRDKYTFYCNIHNISWQSTADSIFSKNTWCTECGKESIGKRFKIDFERRLESLAEIHKAKIVKADYYGQRKTYQFICNKGHRVEIYWHIRDLKKRKLFCLKCKSEFKFDDSFYSIK